MQKLHIIGVEHRRVDLVSDAGGKPPDRFEPFRGALNNATAKRHAVSEETVYAGRKKFGTLKASDGKRLKQQEQENGRPKKMVAERDLGATSLCADRCGAIDDRVSTEDGGEGRPGGDGLITAHKTGRVDRDDYHAIEPPIGSIQPATERASRGSRQLSDGGWGG